MVLNLYLGTMVMDFFSGSSQHIGVTSCFRLLFTQFVPDRIVELGTGTGHFTRWLADALPTATIYTFDNETSLQWDASLVVPPHVCRITDSIWNRQLEITSLIAEPGVRTLLLCDNGDKIREFRTFAPYVREGNIVMVHDYWPSRSGFIKEVEGRLWNSCEIVHADIEDTLKAADFVPFHEHQMRGAMWGCWIRRMSASERTPETCPHRKDVYQRLDHEAATCGVLGELTRVGDDSCRVSRDECLACCESFPPSTNRLNPVLASSLYARLESSATTHLSMIQQSRLREFAERHLVIEDIVEPHDCFTRLKGKSLEELVPPTKQRFGSAVREWAVAVTTSPRSSPTLRKCLEHLAIAGWERPYLFVDAAVRIPQEFASLSRTIRDEAAGAWPNYYLALTEMYLRQPRADAFMLVQDDALLLPQEGLREYLERTLWPGTRHSIVSLYCAAPDTAETFGWTRRRGWDYGVLAMIFSQSVVGESLVSRPVLEHRLQDGNMGLTGIPEVISAWAQQHDVDFYYPTPSFVQHIGHASTLCPSLGPEPPGRRATTEW